MSQIDKERLLEWLKEKKSTAECYKDNSSAMSYKQVIDLIESGTFDIKDPAYKCPECDEINSAVSWNTATKSYYNDDITEIQEGIASFFICPECGKIIERCNIKEDISQ